MLHTIQLAVGMSRADIIVFLRNLNSAFYFIIHGSSSPFAGAFDSLPNRVFVLVFLLHIFIQRLSSVFILLQSCSERTMQHPKPAVVSTVVVAAILTVTAIPSIAVWYKSTKQINEFKIKKAKKC